MTEYKRVSDGAEFLDYGKVNPSEPDLVYTGPKKVSDAIRIKLDIEVAEAITGLKSLQREAKAATKALAELREEQRSLNIEGVAQVLAKFLESPKVDTLKLKDALGILTSIERIDLAWGEIRESWGDAINGGTKRK
ncbi:hypothetical protein [Bacillus sp. FSL M7-0417]|uniref:hypothetical protein n=1 Tax=Bacillus sp. FSL M7-0417 TaxID=2921532 RepID=UPI002E251B44|nr:hypothetical protein [Bacillus subtilis]